MARCNCVNDHVPGCRHYRRVAPIRRMLPSKRESQSQRFELAGHTYHITCGEYEDGSLGEIFISSAKDGDMLRGYMNAIAILTSLGLQYGVPLEEYCDAFIGFKCPPSGFVKGCPDITRASSALDFIFRWLKLNYVGNYVETD